MDLEIFVKRLLVEGGVSRDAASPGHSALEGMDIAINRSVVYCSRLVLLREIDMLSTLICFGM